jgi:hypothetical protein
MKPSEVLEAIRMGRAEMSWVALAEGLEVMARAAKVGNLLVAVSARAAQQCAEALSSPRWVVSLTPPEGRRHDLRACGVAARAVGRTSPKRRRSRP